MLGKITVDLCSRLVATGTATTANGQPGNSGTLLPQVATNGG